MKKILTLFGTFTLIGTSTTNLVACNKKQYSENKLKKEKEKHNLNINGNILEGIASQEKPFKEVDNKGYFVVWRVDANSYGNITKFKNNTIVPKDKKINISNGKNYGLYLANSPIFKKMIFLSIWRDNALGYYSGGDESNNYFKSVYRWNSDIEPNKDVENKLKSYLNL